MSPRLHDVSGRRFGSWLVLRRAPNHVAPSGQAVTMWWCRCRCGAERAVRAGPLVQGRPRQCMACRRREEARRGRSDMSVRLPSGRTIAEIAAEADVPLDTVYGRWRRGWAERDLGLPVGQYTGGRKGRGCDRYVRPAVTLRGGAP